MSLEAILLLAYGVVGLGCLRVFARDQYYNSKDPDKFAASIGWGFLLGAFWPLLAVVFFLVEIVPNTMKWLNARHVAKKIRAGLVLLVLGRPPKKEVAEVTKAEISQQDPYNHILEP